MAKKKQPKWEDPKAESRKLVWTIGYSPFRIGLPGRHPVGTWVDSKDLGKPIELGVVEGKLVRVYVLHNPVKKKLTHVVEERSGAFVGSSLAKVKRDFKTGDQKLIDSQIATSLATVKDVEVEPPENFWARFKEGK